MKADELWDKHASDTDGVRFLMRQDDFLAALKEYGELVKAEAVKVCESEICACCWEEELLVAAEHLSDAISKMELP